MPKTPKTLLEWLIRCKCKEIIVGTIQIAGEVFPAARYKQDCDAPVGCKNPGPYTREAIYVVGERPKKLLKGKFAFTMDGEQHEWYVSTYMLKENLTEQVKEFHPFGLSFQIAPWNVSGKVDDHERKPYERMKIEFRPALG